MRCTASYKLIGARCKLDRGHAGFFHFALSDLAQVRWFTRHGRTRARHWARRVARAWDES